jgi:hypothetical protein
MLKQTIKHRGAANCKMLRVALLLLLRQTHALLPPHFHETLLCPLEHCLARHDTPLVGPQRALFRCLDARGRATPPVAWTTPDGQALLEAFHSDGYHSRTCADHL